MRAPLRFAAEAIASPLRHRLKSVAVAGLLLAILLLFFHRFVFRGEVLSPADLLFSLPPWQYAHSPRPPLNALRSDEALLYQPIMISHWTRLKQGEFPTRDPSHLAGDAAFLQGLFTGLTVHPLSILYYVSSPLKADGLFAIARLWLAGLFMYAYCRRLHMHVTAAAFAAVCYMLNGHFVVWLTSPIPTVALWLPLALLGAERLFVRPDGRSLAIVAAALTPMYLGGYLPTAVLCLLVLAAYIAVGSGVIARGSRTPLRDGVSRVALAGGGVCLSLVAGGLGLLPTAAHVFGSQLQERFAASQPMTIGVLATFVFPDFWGSPIDYNWRLAYTNYCEAVAYLGLAPWVLAAIALAACHGWRTRFFGGLGLFVLGNVYGVPGFRLIGQLPILSSINNRRWLVALALAVSVLSGIGLDALLRGTERARRLAVRLTTALAAVMVIGLVVASYSRWEKILTLSPPVLFAGLRVATLLTATVLIIIGIARVPRRAAAGGLALVAVLAIDLVVAGIRFNPTIPVEDFYPTTPAIEWLRRHAGESRVAFVGDGPVGMMPGTVAAAYGLRSLGGYDLRGADRYQALLSAAMFTGSVSNSDGFIFLGRSLNPRSPVLDLLGARFVVSPPDLDLSLQPIATVAASDSSTGDLTDGRQVGQTFRCPLPGLARIDVFPRTENRPSGTLVFRLREAGSHHDLVRRDVRLDEIQDSSIVSITFSPLYDSAARSYEFSLESRGAAAGRPPAFYATSGDPYIEGTRIEGTGAVVGDLRFVAYVRPPDLRSAYHGEVNITENMDVMPPAWVVRETDVDQVDSAVVRVAQGYPIRTRALLDSPLQISTADASPPRGPAQTDRVDILERSPDELAMHVSLTQPALLIVSERFDRRWHASVDGRPASVVVVDAVLTGVPVPAGSHDVRLEYRDPMVAAGAVSTAAGLSAILGLAILGTRRRGDHTHR